MRRIGDYALLGDCQSVALVSREGSIDWACFPHFDSPSSFCGILDPARGGSFQVAPFGRGQNVRRAYLEDTNVLCTRFATPSGVLELVDAMPVHTGSQTEPGPVASHAILRRLRCLEGKTSVRVVVAPRFEYGAFEPRFTRLTPHEAAVVGGADAFFVTATHPIGVADARVRGRWDLTAGQEVWIEGRWCPAAEERREAPDPSAFAERLAATVSYWREWMRGCRAHGPHAALVRRSALVLKALTFAPTGAVVAAPTTSLPEEIGGGRNWDYRYTWVRDASLTLTSLTVSGFAEEAAAFKGWLERTGAGRPEDLQIMYGIRGHRSLPEIELDHLAGHRSSRPVRIGNGAATQTQLDCYGQLLEGAWLFSRVGGELTPSNWRVLAGYVDQVCRRWRSADHGIWEIRDRPRHFVYSKLHCWLALDRGLRIAKRMRALGTTARWVRERNAVERALLEHANTRGWFAQALDSEVPDAATLVVPALGFLPASDPRVQRTVDVVTKELGEGGLLHRYQGQDGLEGGEGAFLLCSFWLVDALAHGGRLEEAEAVLHRLLGLANDVGLFAEEADLRTGEALGNFPQAFTHMALVTSCAHLEALRDSPPEPGSRYDFAAFLVKRRARPGPPPESLQETLARSRGTLRSVTE